MTTILAQRGNTPGSRSYLLTDDPNPNPSSSSQAYVHDSESGFVGPEMIADAIIKFGYWDEYTEGAARAREIIVEAAGPIARPEATRSRLGRKGAL